MILACETIRPFSQNSAFIRALDSLWDGDADTIARAVDAVGGGWLVQTGDDYDGYLFMLIEPTSENTKSLPSYLVSGRTRQLELAAIYGDECQTLGRFAEVGSLLSDLTLCLLRGAGKSS